MRNYLYLDIETIPCQDEDKCAAMIANAKPPANMKKPETIQKWRDEGAGDIVAKTSFDGGAGHVCCIGYHATDSGGVDRFYMNRIAAEKSMLMQFAKFLQIDYAQTIPVIVGHNVNNFDIRFIWQRAICLGVKLPNWFPKDPKPWGEDTFDTMTAWAGQRGTVSLDNLAGYLGLQGKSGVDGSMVAGMWAEGKHQEIADYCMDDVRLTKAIHEKMMEAGL
jgi:DNA polymerase elongation subunit (family B)